MGSSVTFGVYQDYYFTLQQTKSHGAFFAIGVANILTRDREVVPDGLSPIEIKAMIPDVYTAL